MAYTTTPAEVLAAARRRADQVNGSFREDEDILALMDTTWAEIWETVLTAQPERAVKSVDLETASDQDTYALADIVGENDVWKVKDIDAVVSGRSINLEQFQWEERNRYQYGGGWNYARPLAWRIVGDDLVVRPKPTGVYSLTLWYHPVPVKWSALDLDTDVDTVTGWDEALIVGVAWKLALEEEDLELADRLGAEFQRQLSRILTFGAVRVTEKTEQARDVYASAVDEDLLP